VLQIGVEHVERFSPREFEGELPTMRLRHYHRSMQTNEGSHKDGEYIVDKLGW
jgi:hypothetical protein